MRTLLLLLLASGCATAAAPVKVLVWDERQPRQSEAYDNFLGNEIARRLGGAEGIDVVSVGQDDPDLGLGALDAQEVLLWWGHVRQHEVPDEVGKRIVERVRTGKLALIALHSAHWSVPFMEAMYARTRSDARRRFPDAETKFEFVPPPGRYPPTYDSIVTPAYYALMRRGKVSRVRVDLPNCVFPGVDAHGRPSMVTVTRPSHPIVKGVPVQFDIPSSEMYDEPFHVPDPDLVLFREEWRGGGRFRGGMLWNLGRGKVFYFRPGHETFPVFKDANVMRILENAVQWMGSQVRR
ncbi:MAG: ThuA domain-containing protein [Bryobacterales bacterium]|nr:ThuA domain-containing protein [Bryobacterales bacterium]MDE0626085.1 ThuA domain-containing protein [Bryobacterales bacterium]